MRRAMGAGVPVTVSLVNDQTGAVAGSATVRGDGDWKRVHVYIEDRETRASANNHLMLTIPQPGRCG
jgi:hypothetical protein